MDDCAMAISRVVGETLKYVEVPRDTAAAAGYPGAEDHANMCALQLRPSITKRTVIINHDVSRCCLYVLWNFHRTTTAKVLQIKGCMLSRKV